MKRLCFLIICGAMAAMAAAQVAGPWHGELAVGAQALPVVFNFEEVDGGLLATLDSPLQGAKGIPAQASLSGDTLRVSVAALGADYLGIVAEGRIEGKFRQSGMTLPLTLEPGEYVPPRPQTPRGPYMYRTRDVSFVNPADSAVLAATLTLPVQYQMPVYKTFPLVVFVSGSGAQDRDEEIMGHKPFAVLADRLAKSGIASLRYDDRGFGLSTGSREAATTATYAGDARAAIEWARANFDKAGAVGVIGHSEGGEIAYELAADGSADFIVSIAGPAMRGDSTLLLQNEALLRGAVSDADLSKYLSGLSIVFGHIIDDINGAGAPEEAVEAEIAALGLPQGMADNLRAILATRNPWTDYMIAYDPAQAIGKIRVPVLAVGSDLDRQVIAEPNFAALRRSLPADTPCEVIIYPGLNHMLQPARTGLPAEYGQIEQTLSEDAIRDIVRWINSL